jgi:hypothetical protein
VSESVLRRFGRLRAFTPGLFTEDDWERSPLLAPRAASARPALISDGAGLPFAPSALEEAGGELDRSDPAVVALIEQIARNEAKAQKRRRGKRPPAGDSPTSLTGWRQLAREDDQVLFARGRPPKLLTVTMRRDGRRGWTSESVSTGRPLRVTRDHVRASGWRLDPTFEFGPEETILRVLITEQTWAGGKRADDRLLAPDLHLGAETLVLTTFVQPLPGFQTRSRNPETPARVVLPEPVGSRQLLDGALFGPPGP